MHDRILKGKEKENTNKCLAYAQCTDSTFYILSNFSKKPKVDIVISYK